MRPHLAPLIVLFLVAACGSTRDAVLVRAMAGLDAASRVFVAQDVAAQDRIVAEAPSHEQGRAALEAYRARRDKVAAGFVLAYSAVAAASVDLTEASLQAALVAGAEVVQAMRALFPGGGR